GVWTAGTYTVVLSTFANPGIGNLSDGFFANQILGLASPSNFTCQTGPLGYQGSPPTIPVDKPFCDEWLPNTERTGNWALDFYNVDSATMRNAPEPDTLPLMLAGILLLGGAAAQLRRRAA
ncbi:MAG TPA: DVUA0089 family protein, partial [Rhizomicrobium sp.]|nr:DVUA0089 family protein [Rhizomicrobium sp.]